MSIKIQKITTYIVAAIIALLGLSAFNVALAQTDLEVDPYELDYGYDDYGYDSYDYDYGTSEAPAWIFIVTILCYCVAIVVGIAFLVWTIMMIIDVTKRGDDFEQKTLWLVLLIAGLVLGFSLIVTPLYFFMVKKKLGDPTPKAVTPAPKAE